MEPPTSPKLSKKVFLLGLKAASRLTPQMVQATDGRTELTASSWQWIRRIAGAIYWLIFSLMYLSQIGWPPWPACQELIKGYQKEIKKRDQVFFFATFFPHLVLFAAIFQHARRCNWKKIRARKSKTWSLLWSHEVLSHPRFRPSQPTFHPNRIHGTWYIYLHLGVIFMGSM